MLYGRGKFLSDDFLFLNKECIFESGNIIRMAMSEEKINVIEYLVCCIGAFAQRFDLTLFQIGIVAAFPINGG